MAQQLTDWSEDSRRILSIGRTTLSFQTIVRIRKGKEKKTESAWDMTVEDVFFRVAALRASGQLKTNRNNRQTLRSYQWTRVSQVNIPLIQTLPNLDHISRPIHYFLSVDWNHCAESDGTLLKYNGDFKLV